MNHFGTCIWNITAHNRVYIFTSEQDMNAFIVLWGGVASKKEPLTAFI